MRFAVLLPLAAMVLAACVTATGQLAGAPGPAATAGVPFDAKKFDALQPGVSTKADAIKLLGKPSQEMPSLNNFSTLMYDFAITPSAEHPNDRKMIVAVLFDEKGKFVRYRAYAGPG